MNGGEDPYKHGVYNISILGQSYQFKQPIILFWEVGNLRLLKIHIMFCPPRGADKGVSSWTMKGKLCSAWIVFSPNVN